jgi:hypothetical protein
MALCGMKILKAEWFNDDDDDNDDNIPYEAIDALNDNNYHEL